MCGDLSWEILVRLVPMDPLREKKTHMKTHQSREQTREHFDNFVRNLRVLDGMELELTY